MIIARTISSKPQKLRTISYKIALQINCKMGDALWAVNVPTRTMMVCGVDVYNDPSKRGHSVVGFVASSNPTITNWYSRAKYQQPGTDIADTLKICLVECLHKYGYLTICFMGYNPSKYWKLLHYLFPSRWTTVTLKRLFSFVMVLTIDSCLSQWITKFLNYFWPLKQLCCPMAQNIRQISPWWLSRRGRIHVSSFTM